MSQSKRDVDYAVIACSDEVLIFWCDDALASAAASVAIGRGTVAAAREGKRVMGLVSKAIATRATTLRGMKAKAALYKEIPSDELAESLAEDVLAA